MYKILNSGKRASLVRCVRDNVTGCGGSDTIADATEPRNLCWTDVKPFTYLCRQIPSMLIVIIHWSSSDIVCDIGNIDKLIGANFQIVAQM